MNRTQSVFRRGGRGGQHDSWRRGGHRRTRRHVSHRQCQGKATSVADLVPVGSGSGSSRVRIWFQSGPDQPCWSAEPFWKETKLTLKAFLFNFSIRPGIWILIICSPRIWITFWRRRGCIRTRGLLPRPQYKDKASYFRRIRKSHIIEENPSTHVAHEM